MSLAATSTMNRGMWTGKGGAKENMQILGKTENLGWGREVAISGRGFQFLGKHAKAKCGKELQAILEFFTNKFFSCRQDFT